MGYSEYEPIQVLKADGSYTTKTVGQLLQLTQAKLNELSDEEVARQLDNACRDAPHYGTGWASIE